MTLIMKKMKWFGGILIDCFCIIVLLRNCLVATTSKELGPYFAFKGNLVRPSESSQNASHLREPNPTDFKGFEYDKESPKMMLVWDMMKELVSDSDALPYMAEGFRDASIAFRQLLAVMKKETKRSANNKTKLYCPFALTSEDGNDLFENSMFLQIPCGLSRDSSISLVGIPNGDQESFQVQLIETHVPGKQPPVILKYDVRLQGGRHGEGPVIVQNTWTEAESWGIEEKCPFMKGPTSNHTVDGLYICSLNAGTWTNGSQKQRSEEKQLDNSSSYGERMNFPFVMGHPFTATLLPGLEGFHMIVNGKHVTSFPYRENKNTELWSVSGVQFGGGLNILSAMATGLPVVEISDAGSAALDYKAPRLISKKRVFLFVGIPSSAENFDRRMAIRRSWMQYENIRSGEVAVRFFVGLHRSLKANLELWNEANAYGDIQIMPFVDHYNLISLKTIATCFFGVKILPVEYLLKTDDDSFVRIDKIVANLHRINISRGLLYGRINSNSWPSRNIRDKWYVSHEEWPHESYPIWAHGPGYIISRDIAKFIVRGHQERKLRLFKLEDVATGIWIEQFKQSGEEVRYVDDDGINCTGCEGDYVIAHYQKPRLMLCLWQKLQKEKKPICCK